MKPNENYSLFNPMIMLLRPGALLHVMSLKDNVSMKL